MPTSVRTKAPKKQPEKRASLPKNEALSKEDSDFEQSLLMLDNACLSVLQAPAASRKDTQLLYWQQRFINIVNPVSLALMEYKGPRHFHYHYRHRQEDESILRPVLEDPVDMLAQVCRDALSLCRTELVGIDDAGMIEMRHALEAALAEFLGHYREYRMKVDA